MYLRHRSYTLLLLMFFLCLLGCEPKPERQEEHHAAASSVALDKQLIILSQAIPQLKSGDIVLRSGTGPDSYILSRFNQKDKTYSHCGIVMVEDGYPFVYHSIGGEDNPDERLRRDSAALFLTPRFCAGVAIVRYNYDHAHIQKLDTVVREYYAQRPRFDLKFDLASDSTLYCAEFVYKALNKAMADTGYIKTSFAMGRRYAAVDDLFINPHCHIVWKVAF